MKLYIALALLFWLICGVAGAWMLDGNDMNWKTVAGGPFSLIKGYNDTLPHYPGPYD